MTGPVCGAGRILHGSGPVAVPFRTCCAVALLAALGGDTRSALAALPPDHPCAVAVPADAGSLIADAEPVRARQQRPCPPVAVGEP